MKFYMFQGHFTHETESSWPLHFKHSHWWKRRSRSKFASHYAWGTNGVYRWMQDGYKVYMDSYMASYESCFMVTWTISKDHLLEVGRPHTIPGDHDTPNAHNHWLILFYHAWEPTWIEIHWNNNIWLRAQSHMSSHYTWGSVTTGHDFRGVFGQPLDTFLLGSHNSMVTALGSCVKRP